MKFISAIVVSAAALVATVSADMLQINNPTEGTIWKTDVPNFVGWSGNCASMGNDSKSVKVDIVNGPSNAVRYVATLGTLDCSGSNTRADMTVPSTVASGRYSIVIRTFPQESYTNSFEINNPSKPDPDSSSSGSSGQSTSTPGSQAKGNGALASSFLGPSAMLALAGSVILTLQLL